MRAKNKKKIKFQLIYFGDAAAVLSNHLRLVSSMLPRILSFIFGQFEIYPHTFPVKMINVFRNERTFFCLRYSIAVLK